MGQAEQRRTERLLLTVPIRVIGTGTAGGDFSEDTHTVMVNREGARIALKNRVEAEDSIRIVNLENYKEADFRVVGPTSLAGDDPREWGVECQDPGHDIWGVAFPAPLLSQGSEAGGFLECRSCHRQGFWALTLMETEVLDSTGIIQRSCEKCGKPTYWTYADLTRRPREFPPNEPVAPVPRKAEVEKQTEKRREKRVGMKVPIRVRNDQGEVEITKTENMSKGGLAVCLAMELEVGNTLMVMCPYSGGGQEIEQKLEVRRRPKFSFGGLRLYGLRYIR